MLGELALERPNHILSSTQVHFRQKPSCYFKPELGPRPPEVGSPFFACGMGHANSVLVPLGDPAQGCEADGICPRHGKSEASRCLPS